MRWVQCEEGLFLILSEKAAFYLPQISRTFFRLVCRRRFAQRDAKPGQNVIGASRSWESRAAAPLRPSCLGSGETPLRQFLQFAENVLFKKKRAQSGEMVCGEGFSEHQALW